MEKRKNNKHNKPNILVAILVLALLMVTGILPAIVKLVVGLVVGIIGLVIGLIAGFIGLLVGIFGAVLGLFFGLLPIIILFAIVVAVVKTINGEPVVVRVPKSKRKNDDDIDYV